MQTSKFGGNSDVSTIFNGANVIVAQNIWVVSWVLTSICNHQKIIITALQLYTLKYFCTYIVGRYLKLTDMYQRREM